MSQPQVTDEYLLQLQEQQSREHGFKVDIYHSEVGRTIAVFHHGAIPFLPNALKIIKY